MSKFVRPDSNKIPQVYSTFSAKDKHSDVVVSYRVQDLTEEYYEKAVDLMVNHFLVDETFCVCRKLIESEKAVEEFRGLWRNCFAEKLSLACFKDGSDELISVNALMVNIKGVHDENNFQEEGVLDVLKLLDYTTKQFNVYEFYNVDKYLTAYGLTVHTDYRGRAIATMMLKARVPLLKALGLKVTSTAFTAIGSQVASAKAGFEENLVLSYEDLGQLFPTFDFKLSKTKFFKTLSLKI